MALLVLMSTFWLGIVGCQSGPIQETVQPTSIPATFTPLPTSTPTQIPSSTPIPTSTSTPGPHYVAAQPHASSEYALPLTLQYVSDTSATIYFELEQASDGYIFYWAEEEDQANGHWVRFGGDERRHLKTIDGLERGKAYFMAVGIENEVKSFNSPSFMGQDWDPLLFRTLDLDNRSIRVGVVGDSGFGHEITRQLAERMAASDLDFVIHTGDVVYKVEDNTDPLEAFALKYFRVFDPVLERAPLYPVIGNHDYDAPAEWQGLPFYAQVFPPLDTDEIPAGGPQGFRQYYAFSMGPIQILFLDSQAFWTGLGTADQNQWLEERLLDNSYRASIVVMHVAPYSSGLHPNDGVAIRQQWIPLFEQSNVVLVLSGHDHNFQHFEVNDIAYIVSGGGSRVLYDIGILLSESVMFAARTHFVLLELTEDHIDLQAISVDGDILDSFLIEFIQ
jgi:predicted phosphodiesterase